jgi:regulator of sigma E protease
VSIARRETGSKDLITTILAFVVVLGITITIHEFGHFAMAKLLKIRVLVFSLGFGPKLIGFTRGGTDYRLSPLPLGGYVKMAGETYDSEREGAPDEFLSHPRWHRFLVAVSGPFMNILLAVAILASSFIHGVEVAKYPTGPAIAGPVAAGSIADRAGLQTGDRILSVYGNPVTTWEEMEIALGTAPRNSLDIKVLRGDRTLDLHFDNPETELVGPGELGFKVTLPKTIVNMVDNNSPASEAGLQAGDQIISVRGNGKTGNNYNEILNIISRSKGVPLDFEVFRPREGEQFNAWQTPRSALSGETITLSITPIEKEGRVLIGFVPDFPTDLQKYGIAGALTQSIHQNFELAALTFRIIGRILKGSASVRTLSGPIEIARISGSAARTRSVRVFLGFLGLISLQLGIFNLLPIPILDGGVVLLLIIEGSMRRDLSINLKEKIVQAGFVFLILLMGFAVFNDLSKVIDFQRIFG